MYIWYVFIYISLYIYIYMYLYLYLYLYLSIYNCKYNDYEEKTEISVPLSLLMSESVHLRSPRVLSAYAFACANMDVNPNSCWLQSPLVDVQGPACLIVVFAFNTCTFNNGTLDFFTTTPDNSLSYMGQANLVDSLRTQRIQLSVGEGNKALLMQGQAREGSLVIYSFNLELKPCDANREWFTSYICLRLPLRFIVIQWTFWL